MFSVLPQRSVMHCLYSVRMPTAALAPRVRASVDGLNGRAGVYLRHLGTGEEVCVESDAIFPAACMVKVPILLTLLQRVVDGELDWESTYTVTPDRSYGLDQVVDRLRVGSQIELAELVHLMVSVSDVAAGLWCQEIAGGGERVNAWLADRGYAVTRINSRTPGREAEFERWGWGQITPREACDLLVSIRERRAVSPAADAHADRILSATLFIQDSIAALPTDVHVILKTGAVDRSRSEVLLVAAEGGTYACCTMTDDLADQSWGLDNAGMVLLREVTGLAWEHWGDGARTGPPDPWPPPVAAP